jgi:hypothetical protein
MGEMVEAIVIFLYDSLIFNTCNFIIQFGFVVNRIPYPNWVGGINRMEIMAIPDSSRTIQLRILLA